MNCQSSGGSVGEEDFESTVELSNSSPFFSNAVEMNTRFISNDEILTEIQ